MQGLACYQLTTGVLRRFILLLQFCPQCPRGVTSERLCVCVCLRSQRCSLAYVDMCSQAFSLCVYPRPQERDSQRRAAAAQQEEGPGADPEGKTGLRSRGKVTRSEGEQVADPPPHQTLQTAWATPFLVAEVKGQAKKSRRHSGIPVRSKSDSKLPLPPRSLPEINGPPGVF